jgi:hypothetical protein
VSILSKEVPQWYPLGDYFLLNLAYPVILDVLIGAVSGGVLLPLAAKVILGLIGFSPLGPVAGKSLIEASRHIVVPSHAEYAGSIAAAIQALIGNVAAGSLFALLQSLAMGGALGGALGAIGGIVGGIIGAIGAFF